MIRCEYVIIATSTQNKIQLYVDQATPFYRCIHTDNTSRNYVDTFTVR